MAYTNIDYFILLVDSRNHRGFWARGQYYFTYHADDDVEPVTGYGAEPAVKNTIFIGKEPHTDAQETDIASDPARIICFYI